MGRLWPALPVLAVAGALAFACTSTTRDLLVVPYDAGSDARTPDAADAGDASAGDAPSTDADLNLGQPCTDDAQCDEGIKCEYFSCNPTYHRCTYTPDDSQCQDGIYCDGMEVCVLHHGCAPGPVVTCDDGNPCTIDHCDEATMSCVRVPRDEDQDGDPDDHCYPKHDCNDQDPTVSSKHAEVCANHKDDNCNGLIDEMPCVVVEGGTCAAAVPITTPGNYALSTLGASLTFGTSCTVSTPAGSANVVAAVTVPAGPNVDLDVWAVSASGAEVALAIDRECGEAATELTCNSDPGASSMHARASNVPPGTYYVVVTTAATTSVQTSVQFLPPSPPATNETCASALPLTLGTPTEVSILDPATDLVTACPAGTGLLTYSFTLATAADVRVYATTVEGSGTPVVGLRDPHCTDPADELACGSSGMRPLFVRNQPPGTYVVTVGGSSPIDVTLVVETSAPTVAPADESCVSPPSITLATEVPVDLSNNDNAIKDGCFAGGPNAAFDLPLAAASDVLLVGRFPESGDVGAVSLDDSTCTAAGQLACSVDSTPTRVGKRNVAPGDYRAVIGDSTGQQDTLMVLARPTTPPIAVMGQISCTNPVTIPAAGGFFAGDTSTSLPHYEESCDGPNQPQGGAPDQTLALTLTTPQRVIFDMEGSTFETLLVLLQGSPCPGMEVPSTCYVGFDTQRSFLDVELTAGQYFVVVDGYAGAKGPWNMAVWVLPP